MKRISGEERDERGGSPWQLTGTPLRIMESRRSSFLPNPSSSVQPASAGMSSPTATWRVQCSSSGRVGGEGEIDRQGWGGQGGMGGNEEGHSTATPPLQPL